MPFIFVNLDLLQQEYASIGRDVTNPTAYNVWTIPVLASRLWRVTVFARNPKERDFYRDTLLVAFQVLVATVFNPLGENVTHRFQAVSGTDSREWEGKTPGFLLLGPDVGVVRHLQRQHSDQLRPDRSD